jgi:hypothetical protein
MMLITAVKHYCVLGMSREEERGRGKRSVQELAID